MSSYSSNKCFKAAILSLSILLISPVNAVAQSQLGTTIPSTSSKNTAELWREVMVYFYGPYDRSRKCWIGKGDAGGGPAKFCMRPHKLDITGDGAGRKFHFVTGGYQINQGGGQDKCHVCAGNMGMIVLGNGGETLLVVALNSLYRPYGSWGRVPPEENFTFQKLGPRDAFGWLVRTGWMGQGITINGVSLFGVFDDTVREIGTVPLGYTDGGICMDGKNHYSGKPCTEYSYEFLFDTTDQSSPFYPIILKLTGTREGERLNQTFRVPFDDKLLSYQLPDGMPDGR